MHLETLCTLFLASETGFEKMYLVRLNSRVHTDSGLS